MKKKKHLNKKRVKGSVTILLIIILIPSILLSGIIVDTSRVNIGKASISSAGELAMSTALSKYDTIVKEVYGLFAMTQNMTEEERTAAIRRYFERTLVSYGITDEVGAGDYLNSLLGDFNSLIAGTPDGDMVNLLGMKIADGEAGFNVVTPKESSLANPNVMRKQIVDYMKLRGPINFGLSIFDVANSFKTINKQTEVVEKQVVAQESMQDVVDGCKVTIDGIREYDALLKDVRTGDRKVIGLEKYGDSANLVPVEDYNLQILKYRIGEYNIPGGSKAVWDNNYKHINRLIMCFLLKVPETKGMYLTEYDGKSINEYFVTDSGINPGGSGISVSVSTSSDEATAESAFTSQLNKLGPGSSYEKTAQAYNAYDFVAQGYLNANGNFIKPETEDSAIESFIEYEKFITDTDGAKSKYSDVKKVFEELYVLAKLYSNYDKILEKKVNDAQKEFDKASAGLQKAEDELQKIEDDISDAEAKKKKAKTPAGIAEAEEKINKLKEKKTAKKTEVETLSKEKSDKESTLNLNKELRENKNKDYTTCAKRYVLFCRNYIWDIKAYNDYQAAAKVMVGEEVRKIDEQFSLIVSNLEILSQALGQTAVDLSQILIEVEKYDGNVNAWRAANQSYIGENGNDTFSAANSGEIEAAHKNINKDDVQVLIDYVKSIDAEYQTLYDFIVDSGTKDFKYGSKKVYEISDYKTALKMADSKKDSLPAIVTKNDADTAFEGLYAESVLLDVFNDQDLILSLIKPDPRGLPFLVYLDKTYPESSGEGENSEDETKYKEMMKNLKSDNNGGAITDGGDYTKQYVSKEGSATADTSKLSYSYYGRKISGKNLPSVMYGVKQDEKKAQSLKVEEKGKKIHASESLQSSRTSLNSAIGGIGKIASTSLENIYIVDYMFENFSYNTMMQDMIIKGEKVEQIIDAKGTLKEAETVAKYVDKAVTLSNIPINGYNNYLYGAEIEYMIYGKQDIEKNVTSAKASIYAIRCAFNMIYAFTNPDIRTETRNIGLAVQAATLNIVPYQVVQVVLQLALSFAESAIDLTAICNGMKVALVKSEDTWNLSIQKSVGIVGDYLAQAASQYAEGAITSAGEALQKVVDSKASDLIEAVNALSEDLESATRNELKKIVGQGFEYFENKLLGVLDDISLENYNGVRGTLRDGLDKTQVLSAGQVIEKINGKIDSAYEKLDDELKKEMTGIPLFDDALRSLIVGKCNDIRIEIETEIADEILAKFDYGLDGCGNATELICKKLNDWQKSITNSIDKTLTSIEITNYIKASVNDAIYETEGNLKAVIAGYSSDISEETAAVIKEKVNGFTNSFINNYIPNNAGSNVGNSIAAGKNSDSVSSIIKLGYKEYLMLFAFIEVCSSETHSDRMLARMADLIQLNIQNTSENSSYQHKKHDKFLMSEAYTYVGIDATIEMDMLFIDMDFFRKSFDDETGTYDTTLSRFGTIEYTGLQGY